MSAAVIQERLPASAPSPRRDSRPPLPPFWTLDEEHPAVELQPVDLPAAPANEAAPAAPPPSEGTPS